MKRHFVPACLALLLAAPAFAADAGPYLFGNLGAAGGQWKLKDGAAAQAGLPSGTESKKDDSAGGMWELGAGYRVNDYFAVEGSYLKQNGGAPITKAGSLSFDAWRLAALGIVPITDNFELYGKVSVNRIGTDFQSQNVALASSKDHSTGLGLGIGAGYRFTKALSARVELESLGKAKHGDITDNAPIGVFKAGLAYQF